jgi:hypothetical protein
VRVIKLRTGRSQQIVFNTTNFTPYSVLFWDKLNQPYFLSINYFEIEISLSPNNKYIEFMWTLED